MSYCRWSSDNFNCDIYAYEGADGYVIHICGGRYKGEIPKTDMSFLEDNTEENRNKYIESSKIQSEYLKNCGTEPIELKYTGESFTLTDIEDFYNKMLELKNIGYRLPDGVLEGIKQEMAEQIK